MKKYILVIILTTLFMTPQAFGENLETSPVVDPQDIIFRSSLTNIADEINDTVEEYSDEKFFKEVDPNNMPLFKQIRLRFANSCLYMSNRPKKEKDILKKLKIRKKETVVTDKEQEIEETNSDISSAIDDAIKNPSDDTISLEGGINAEKTEKHLSLDAENITFDDDTGDMIATGRPKLYIPPQNTEITADKMLYNEGSNILKAIGNVKIIKDGIPMDTDELEINMNEETLSMDNIRLSASRMIIEAKNAIQQDGKIILNNGSLNSDNSSIYRLTSEMVGPDFASILPAETQTLFFGQPEKNKFGVHASYIEVDARKNHDIITAKKIKFSHNDKVYFKWPSIKLYTNKQHDYFEGNYPELGSYRKLGLFAGPGLAFGGPFGSTIKVMPIVNYNSKFGIGGLMKYVNTYNRTELGYGSSKNVFFLKGIQKLDDNLTLQYSYNSFTNEWFLGGRMPKYIAEIYYHKSHPHKDFLGEGRNLTFSHRIGFGFAKDDNKNYNGEHFNENTNMSTTRTRYMAELRQNVYSYKNEKNRFDMELNAVLQGSAAVYGTGDTQFVARFGPSMRVRYKNWLQDVSYFLTGYDDKTPLQHYDAYRYGRSSVRITEAFRITKYLSVGWVGYLNFSNDAPNSKIFQENAFLISVGPDDFKVVLGYDFMRDRTYFGFNIAFDPKGTSLTYDKMVIKNPERLGNSENERQIAFIIPPKEDINEIKETKFLIRKPEDKINNVLEYATVIEIEDPDKERID